MRKNSICLLLTALFIGLFPVGCVDQCDGPCGCNPVFENRDFSISELSIETLIRSDNNQPVEANRFYFNQSIFKAFFVSDLRPVASSSSGFGPFLFFSPAYACDTPYSYAVETLRSIRIVNRAKVNIKDELILESGEVINEHFVLTLNFQNEYSINDFLRNNHRFQIGERLNLKFNCEPQKDTELRFDLEIELTDGRTFEFRNEIMRIAGA